MADNSCLVVDYELLEGVTSEMLDWWWDNMGPTERYKLWHPEDHTFFEWEVSPAEVGHVGAIQSIEEYIGGKLFKGRIRWDEPASAPLPPIYRHVMAASGLTPDGTVRSRIVHEYEDVDGGVRYRTTFLWPEPRAPEAIEAVRQHNIGEVSMFPRFLPGLYASETARS